MISKEKFCKIIERLENYSKLQDKINDLFREFVDNAEQDFCNAGGICIGHETVVVDLLCSILEPGIDNRDSLISWWIYETEYGKNHDMAYVILKDGTKVELYNAGALYDLLIKELKATRNMQSSAETAEKTADEMWRELGYKSGLTQWGGLRLKKDYDNIFIFNEENKSFYKTGEYDSACDNITMLELKAINKKCFELGWLDE